MSDLTIWKFPIFSGFTPEAVVEMPEGAEILVMQKDVDGAGPATIWARVDPTARKVVRKFEHVGTGQQVPRGGKYVGTWQQTNHDGQNFVFHVFEVPPFEAES